MRTLSSSETIRVILFCWLSALPTALAYGQQSESAPGAVVQSLQDPLFDTPPSSAETNVATTEYRLLTTEEPTSKFTIKPYGSLWTNVMSSTSRTSPGQFTLWVFSEEDQGESAFEIDARRSRVGIEIEGAEIELGSEKFRSAGRVELDFFGQFLTENAAGVRLRHAYWEASNDQWRMLVGQSWDLISPLRPNTLNFTVGWAGGNIGFRRAQLLAERTAQFSADTSLLFAASLNQDIIPDFPTESGIRRESASLPVIMTRVAISRSLRQHTQPMVIGFSGHYGETGFDFLQTGPPPLSLPPQDDARFPTWSVNMDADIPIAAGLSIRGEAFHGANLSPFLGGIGQGVCPCLRKSVHSTGGWLELAKRWSSSWESHAGTGIDDPANGDFLVGRGMNQFVYVNQIWHATDALSTGLELAWWRTTYHEARGGQIPPNLLSFASSGEAYVLECMVRYDF